MLNILIVEDHALVREGLMLALSSQMEGQFVMREAGCANEALEALKTASPQFDLVLLDLALPGMDGFACLRLKRERHPKVPVVVLSAYDDQMTINRVLAGGASSFISKTHSGRELAEILSSVLAGHLHRPRANLASGGPMLDGDLLLPPTSENILPQECGLTERQSQVLSLMVKGKSNREISQHLGISEGTVKIHVAGVFKTLGVSSRTQAIALAMRYGVIAG
ncbi:MAG: response regulator transcription factor [Zoogloeaceae bacterium]|jgi:DNA-binding NarL/FixJ family response regulator|nr:response regulator transcription factor [Zoogloeaceae bacterium]